MMLKQIRVNNIRDILKEAVDACSEHTLADVLYVFTLRGELDLRLERVACNED